MRMRRSSAILTSRSVPAAGSRRRTWVAMAFPSQASVPIPKFARVLRHAPMRTSESKDTRKSMILVPLLNPKFAYEPCPKCCANFGLAALVFGQVLIVAAHGVRAVMPLQAPDGEVALGDALETIYEDGVTGCV